jgi:energy-coupling factor transporter ATP-binding protein EcfA2
VPRPERPLDDGDDEAVRQFAADLRTLRVQAGSPPYRELGRRAHYSAGTLSEAANGRKLPSLAVTLAYVDACGGEAPQWKARWQELAAALHHNGRDSARQDEAAPYAGLESFGPEDAERFHGRDKLIARLVSAVAGHRIVVVVGASGSGKSSLVRAGLVPAARSGALGGPWADVVISPGTDPFDSWSLALATAMGISWAAVKSGLDTGRGAMSLTHRQLIAQRGECGELLLVVDQFEEIFTLCSDDAVRRRFVDSLVAAAEHPPTRVVLVVRADFYTHYAQHPRLAELLQEAQVLVGPMSGDEMREAITQPALRSGYRVETALLARLLTDSTGQTGALPLLSHALLETWHRRQGTTLTLAAYEATGGVQHAIAHTAEQVYTSLTDAQKHRVRLLLSRLVAFGDGTEHTKRRLSLAEVDVDDTDTLERLVQARLLTRDRDTVEIAHEALIRTWPRLAGWLTEGRAELLLHRQLTDAAAIWESLDRDDSALYRGSRLDAVRYWAATENDALTLREQEFIEASQRSDRSLAAKLDSARRFRLWILVLAVLHLIAVITVVLVMLGDDDLPDPLTSGSIGAWTSTSSGP